MAEPPDPGPIPFTAAVPAWRRRVGLIAVALLVAATFGVSPARAQSSTRPDVLSALTGTLAKVWRTGAFVIGYREAAFPFSYLNARGVPVGYSIDLCKAIASEVAAELGGRTIRVEYRPVSPADRLTTVVNGDVDIECGSTTSSAARRSEVDFSPIIFVAGTKLLVRRSAPWRSLRDLRGRTVVVTAGTTNEGSFIRSRRSGSWGSRWSPHPITTSRSTCSAPARPIRSRRTTSCSMA